ncbi:MAG: alpha/beta hydrolase [Actinomycetota bacterium]|nr:alpha/beta hydrolase [Actinomycetota bacterium]
MTIRWGTARSSDGAEIAYRTVGDGPGVVIVHGSLSDGSDWLAVAEALASEHTVHLLSRRGVGRSSDGATYDVVREYDDVCAVLAATGSTRLVGHSFGAVCALGAALRFETLERLVLYEPPLNVAGPVVADETLVHVLEADARGDVATVVERGLLDCVRMPPALVTGLQSSDLWAEMVRNGVHWARELQALHDLPSGVDRYAAIETKTLLPVGETTEHHHRDAAEALARCLPDASIVELPGVGHEAQLMAPNLMAGVLADFLGSR